MNKKTNLVVDDELNIRILLSDVLERVGFHVLTAKNGYNCRLKQNKDY